MQDQMSQEIRSRYKEMNRKRPADRTEAKPKLQKTVVPEV